MDKMLEIWNFPVLTIPLYRYLFLVFWIWVSIPRIQKQLNIIKLGADLSSTNRGTLFLYVLWWLDALFCAMVPSIILSFFTPIISSLFLIAYLLVDAITQFVAAELRCEHPGVQKALSEEEMDKIANQMFQRIESNVELETTPDGKLCLVKKLEPMYIILGGVSKNYAEILAIRHISHDGGVDILGNFEEFKEQIIQEKSIECITVGPEGGKEPVFNLFIETVNEKNWEKLENLKTGEAWRFDRKDYERTIKKIIKKELKNGRWKKL